MNSDPIVPLPPRPGSPERIHVVKDGQQVPASAGSPLPRPTVVSTPGSAPATPGAVAPHAAAASEALRLALNEGHVFAALTGLPGVGKTAVLDTVLADTPALRVLRIQDAGSVSDRLAAQIEQVALTEASRTESDKHVLLVVDDAHLASVELLDALSRLAAVRRAGGRLPQVLLVGQPILWDRLKAERFRPLERRIVIRPELTTPPTHDAWASVESALGPASAAAPGTVRPGSTPSPTPAGKAASAQASAAPRSSALPAAASDLEPISRIDSLLARRAELVPAAQERRRPARPLIVALLITSIATVAVAAAVQLAHQQSVATPPDVKPTTQASSVTSVSPSLPSNAVPATPETVSRTPSSMTPANPAQTTAAQTTAAQTTAAQTTAAQPGPPEPVPPPVIAPVPASAATTTGPAPGAEPAVVQPGSQPVGVVREPTPATPPPPPAAEPPRPAMSAAPAGRQPAPEQPAQAAVPTAMAPEVVALLLRRGEERLAIGDIVAARSFFERAGAAGNSHAAFLAGRTYDRALLPPDAAGLASMAQATDWYRRAAVAGEASASTRLQQLGASPR